MAPPESILEDDSGERRHEGVTIRNGTAVTLSVAFLLQAGYVVFTLGRTAEKIDAVVADVSEIKRSQYARPEAERDLSQVRRDAERVDRRLNEMDRSIDSLRLRLPTTR